VNALHVADTRVDPDRIARLSVVLLGAGLLLDGGVLILLNALGVAPPGVNTMDTPHNLLHVVWGVPLLAVGLAGSIKRVIQAALVFGAFYVALGVAGLTLHNPFGLQLGPGENVFHLAVGPLAILVGAWALTKRR
jgi:hypothetical protein